MCRRTRSWKKWQQVKSVVGLKSCYFARILQYRAGLGHAFFRAQRQTKLGLMIGAEIRNGGMHPRGYGRILGVLVCKIIIRDSISSILDTGNAPSNDTCKSKP